MVDLWFMGLFPLVPWPVPWVHCLLFDGFAQQGIERFMVLVSQQFQMFALGPEVPPSGRTGLCLPWGYGLFLLGRFQDKGLQQDEGQALLTADLLAHPIEGIGEI